MLRSAPAADGAAAGAADAAAAPAVDAAMLQQLHVVPAVDAVAAAGASDDVSKPFSRLSMCDRGLRDTFQSAMSKEVKARIKEIACICKFHQYVSFTNM